VLQILHWFDPLGLKKSLWLKPTPALVNSLDENLIFFEFFYEERMLVISRGFLWGIGVVPGVFATLGAALSAGSFDELVDQRMKLHYLVASHSDRCCVKVGTK
jgi:hypothetical protein